MRENEVSLCRAVPSTAELWLAPPFLLPLPLSPLRSPLLVLQFLHGRGQKELNVQMVQTMKIGLKDQNKGLFSIWQEIFQLPRVQR